MQFYTVILKCIYNSKNIPIAAQIKCPLMGNNLKFYSCCCEIFASAVKHESIFKNITFGSGDGVSI